MILVGCQIGARLYGKTLPNGPPNDGLGRTWRPECYRGLLRMWVRLDKLSRRWISAAEPAASQRLFASVCGSKGQLL